jgi:hypothetical protein
MLFKASRNNNIASFWWRFCTCWCEIMYYSDHVVCRWMLLCVLFLCLLHDAGGTWAECALSGGGPGAAVLGREAGHHHRVHWHRVQYQARRSLPYPVLYIILKGLRTNRLYKEVKHYNSAFFVRRGVGQIKSLKIYFCLLNLLPPQDWAAGDQNWRCSHAGWPRLVNFQPF